MSYKMIQIPEEAYILLKEHCKNNNLKMGGFIGTLIKEKVQSLNKTTPKNVLPVRGN